MNLDEYITQYRDRYSRFANTVANILAAGLRQYPDVARPLFTTQRAKDPTSLRRKLERLELLETTRLETEIKDLAGCRVVFNTNTDVDRFLNSRIIFENFVVDHEETKVHHPVPGSDGDQKDYRAIHYIVSLKQDRLTLPEYADYAELRCEIQIHTLLNHAWSETSHDIIYKNPVPVGFGTKQTERIKARMHAIMVKYLVPAGYEFQKVQHDFQRIAHGHEILQRRPVEELQSAPDNNRRCELLEEITEHVIPHLDDIRALYPELLRATANAVLDARMTPTKPIGSPYGNFDGKTSEDVTDLAVEMLDRLRFLDVTATFRAYCDFFPGALTNKERDRIVKAVTHLAEHNLDVWKVAGPAVQSDLMRVVAGFDPETRSALRPIVLAACSAVLSSEVSGTSMTSFDTMTFSRGAVRSSEPLAGIRHAAIDALAKAYDEATSDDDRLAAFRSMMEATRLPSAASSDDLLLQIVKDADTVIRIAIDRRSSMSFELWQVVEHDFFWLYRHTPSLAKPDPVAKAIEQLRQSIGTFRDAINADADFVVHKTLVGFQSVFPPDWERDDIVGALSHSYREAKVKEHVSQISDATADYWLGMIRRCAATRSNDGATFMIFSQFLEQISSAHPAFMLRLLDEAPADIIGFLTPIMNGLKTSTAASAAMERLKTWIDNGQYNREVVFYLRFATGTDPALVRTVAKNALATKDDIAALYVIAAIIARDDLHNAASLDAAFIPCLNLLTEKHDARWVDQAWFQPTAKTFFASLSPAHAQALLQNLVFRKTVDYHIEPIIVALAKADYAGVWGFFRQRIKREDASSSQDRYDAIPFQFSEAQKGLAADPAQAVDLVRPWHRDDDQLFEFTGGRLLAITFPGMPDAFRDKLTSIIEVEGASAFSFVRSILSNYRGEAAVHPICQALVENLPDDDERLGGIDTLLSGTGVVTGPFGFVEAYKGKKAAITPWLDDARPKVRTFAQSYIKGIDLRIALEQRSAEQQHEMRKLEWSDP